MRDGGRNSYMEERFLNTVGNVLGVDPGSISLETEYKKYEKWDSFGMMNILMELEEEFEASIPIEKLANVKTLKDLYEMVQ